MVNFAVLAAALFIVGVLGEVIVRVVEPLKRIPLLDENGESLYISDAALGYKLRPSSRARFQRPEFSVWVGTNSHGYRDDEFSSVPEDVVVAGFGDSLAWGHGVEMRESFFEVAESTLQAAYPDARVYNFAVSGYAQLQHLEQLGSAFE